MDELAMNMIQNYRLVITLYSELVKMKEEQISMEIGNDSIKGKTVEVRMLNEQLKRFKKALLLLRSFNVDEAAHDLDLVLAHFPSHLVKYLNENDDAFGIQSEKMDSSEILLKKFLDKPLYSVEAAKSEKKSKEIDDFKNIEKDEMLALDSISEMINTNNEKLKEIEKLKRNRTTTSIENESIKNDVEKFKTIGLEMNNLIKSLEDEFSNSSKPSISMSAKKKGNNALSDDLNDILTEIDGKAEEAKAVPKKTNSKSKLDNGTLVKKGNVGDSEQEVKGMLNQLQSMMNNE